MTDKGKGGAEKSVKDKVRMLTETMRTYPHRVDEQLSSITQLTKLVQQDAGHHTACLPACMPACSFSMPQRHWCSKPALWN